MAKILQVFLYTNLLNMYYGQKWNTRYQLFKLPFFVHCNPVQGQYRARTGFSLCSKFSQGKTCFHYREPLFSLQGPCIHYREFPVRITTQGNPCSHYREWVCSAGLMQEKVQKEDILKEVLRESIFFLFYVPMNF